MTVLIVLLGLALSHFIGPVRKLRDFRWLLWPLARQRAWLPARPWLALVTVIVTVLVVSGLAVWLAESLLGLAGWSLLALGVLVYSLGPRDLDDDVATLSDRSAGADTAEVADVARTMRLSLDEPAGASAAAVLHAALSRWFGVVFWFVVLGIPGALLYRLARCALQLEGVDRGARNWLARLRLVMDWPVTVLMGLSAGLCGDLDRTFRVWREHRDDGPAWLVTPRFLDHLGASLTTPVDDFDSGLRAGHRMAWRMLILWLVVLSLMLLAGWLV